MMSSIENQLSIRLMEERDANRVGELLYQVHDVHAQIRPDLFIAGKRKYDESEVKKLCNDPTKVNFVCEYNQLIVGYAMCVIQNNLNDDSRGKFKTLYIDDLCVDQKYRRMHVATTLFNYLNDYAKENDFYHLVLRVWTGNEDAIAFYQSLGFQVLYSGMEKIVK